MSLEVEFYIGRDSDGDWTVAEEASDVANALDSDLPQYIVKGGGDLT